MTDDLRIELARLWDEHLAAPFPDEWSELEERFGSPDEYPQLRDVVDAERQSSAWGSPDLHLYDPYVAGHVSTILTHGLAGADVLGESEPDARLARYFELCLEQAADAETRQKIEACRGYFEHLNRMLEVARRVPAR